MQTNAPGRGKLKVTGIIYIIYGVLGLLGSLILKPQPQLTAGEAVEAAE